MGVNREHKNTVFTKLFNNADNLLELYNALSGNNCSSDTVIEMNTLENILFMNMMNDISFTVDGKLVVLIEHQSSVSENIPLRILLYIARVYEKIIDKRAAYQQKLIKIPLPEFIVLYNGKSKFPSEKTLRLSDAFWKKQECSEGFGSLELTVRIININPGYNENIVNKSATLRGYVTFIGKIREGISNGLELRAAVTEAVKYCENYQILQPFLTNHASEVLNMLTTEFNMEDAIAVWKEEGREEGRARGFKEAFSVIIPRLKELGMTVEEIAKATSLEVEAE